MIATVNPFTNKTIKTFSAHSETEVSAKIDLAARQWNEWKTTSFEHRADLMKKAAVLLLQKKDKYAELMTLEMGKLLRESIVEVDKCARAFNYYADNAADFLKDTLVQTDAEKSIIIYQPLGVILGIMPWNFPFWQVIRYAVPTLMAGNVCLLKHASNVPQCALELELLFKEAGFPEGCFQTLLIEPNAIPFVIEHEKVAAVTLTGSEAAGSHVASIAGKQIKKTVLELGGSDPFIVLANADLKKAIDTAVKSRMINTGQSCISAKRFIVAEPVYEEFIQLFTQKIALLKSGDPMDNSTEIGPLARVDLAKQLKRQVDASVEIGAKLLCGGNHVDAMFQPTLLANVKPGMPAFDEEMFGPVAAVIMSKDDDEAIALANASRYGLGASVWTKDVEKGIAVARRVESGSVYVNTLMKSDQRMPFGGIKKSGYGRELSKEGIHEFVNAKSMMINS